jgi:hypothetical protein
VDGKRDRTQFVFVKARKVNVGEGNQVMSGQQEVSMGNIP